VCVPSVVFIISLLGSCRPLAYKPPSSHLTLVARKRCRGDVEQLQERFLTYATHKRYVVVEALSLPATANALRPCFLSNEKNRKCCEDAQLLFRRRQAGDIVDELPQTSRATLKTSTAPVLLNQSGHSSANPLRHDKWGGVAVYITFARHDSIHDSILGLREVLVAPLPVKATPDTKRH
jgi:hypothetical protein